MKHACEELAKMIDHSQLHPTMMVEEQEEGCQFAAQSNVVSVCIKPDTVKQAVEWLQVSGVKV